MTFHTCDGPATTKQEAYPWEDPFSALRPETWFHDVFRLDGSFYDSEEVNLIQRFSQQPAGSEERGESFGANHCALRHHR